MSIASGIAAARVPENGYGTYEAKAKAPKYAEDTDSTFTLWQLSGTKSQVNSYVMRTPGNELIVFDGGTNILG